MKLIIDIPDNELKDPLKNIHLLINNGIITEVCIKKYDKDEPYFMDLNYAPLEECDDCISREAAIKAICRHCTPEKPERCPTAEICHSYQELKALPPVTPVELELKSYGSPHMYECSCGYGWDRRTMWRDFFCPNCGREVEE